MKSAPKQTPQASESMKLIGRSKRGRDLVVICERGRWRVAECRKDRFSTQKKAARLAKRIAAALYF